MYAQWSPSHFVKEFKTPTLVIHGELDFRVPYTQGLQLFTALQMQKVPSKLLLFPDEGHWVLKPQNSLLWYKTVHRLDRFLGQKVKSLLGMSVVVVVILAGVRRSLAAGFEAAALSIDPAVKVDRRQHAGKVHVGNPHGVRRVTAVIEQNGARYTVYQAKAASRTGCLLRRKQVPRRHASSRPARTRRRS